MTLPFSLTCLLSLCVRPLKDFRFLFGSKVIVIVLECDWVASGRVCYQKGHSSSCSMCVKVFLVLCWDQSDTMNSLKNVVSFSFIGKSNQNNNLWKNMWTQFQKTYRLNGILQIRCSRGFSIHTFLTDLV